MTTRPPTLTELNNKAEEIAKQKFILLDQVVNLLHEVETSLLKYPNTRQLRLMEQLLHSLARLIKKFRQTNGL